MGDAPRLVASLGRIADVGLILKRLQRTVVELGRHDHRTTTRPARSDLYGFPLGRRDVVALPTTELG